MSNTDVSKLFSLTSIKTNDGKTVKGIQQNNFFMTAGSIFDTEKVNVNAIFDELDTNNDNILTAEELEALTKYMNDDMMQQQEEAAAQPETVQDILNSNQDFFAKLNQIKELKLTDEDIKGLDKSEVQELLNLVSAAYANEPEKIPNDSLCNQILQMRSKEELQEIVNDPKSGYWISKYGKEQIGASIGDKDTSKDTNPEEVKIKPFNFDMNAETQTGAEE